MIRRTPAYTRRYTLIYLSVQTAQPNILLATIRAEGKNKYKYCYTRELKVFVYRNKRRRIERERKIKDTMHTHTHNPHRERASESSVTSCRFYSIPLETWNELGIFKFLSFIFRWWKILLAGFIRELSKYLLFVSASAWMAFYFLHFPLQPETLQSEINLISNDNFIQ